MDTTEIKRRLQTWIEKLSQKDYGPCLTNRIAFLAIYAVLTYLGVDASELFDEEET